MLSILLRFLVFATSFYFLAGYITVCECPTVLGFGIIASIMTAITLYHMMRYAKNVRRCDHCHSMYIHNI